MMRQELSTGAVARGLVLSKAGAAFVLTALAVAMIAAPARAVTFTWTGGATNDNWTSAGNWTGGTTTPNHQRPHNLNDDVLYNSSSVARLATGIALNPGLLGSPSGLPDHWRLAKITVANVSGDVTINPDGANTEIHLSGSIGGVGVDMSAAAADLTLRTVIRLTGAQSWNIAPGRTLTKSNGDLLLNGNNLTITGGGDAMITSLITGGGNLVVTTPGTVTLTGNNTYAGNTSVGSAGSLATLHIQGNHSGGGNLNANSGLAGGKIFLADGASFSGNGNLNAPFFSTVELGAGASMTMLGSGNIAAGSTVRLLDGATLNLGATLTINVGANPFGGQLNLGSGSVATAGQDITVGPVGSITGVGTVASTTGDVIFQSGSFLIPGQSAGTLTFDTPSGSLDISGAAASSSPSFIFELGPVGDSDMVVLTSGLLDIGTDLLGFDDFAFIPLAGFGPGEYVLFDANAPIVGTLGTDLTGEIDGFVSMLSLANSSQDIVLRVLAVPEPGSLAAWILAALVAGALAWRKRAAALDAGRPWPQPGRGFTQRAYALIAGRAGCAASAPAGRSCSGRSRASSSCPPAPLTPVRRMAGPSCRQTEGASSPLLSSSSAAVPSSASHINSPNA